MTDLKQLEQQLRGLLKGEHSSLTISFNDHTASYMNVPQAIKWGMINEDDWVSPEECDAAIANESVWTIQWYPDSPVGFYRWSASTLEAALTAAFAAKDGDPL